MCLTWQEGHVLFPSEVLKGVGVPSICPFPSQQPSDGSQLPVCPRASLEGYRTEEGARVPE